MVCTPEDDWCFYFPLGSGWVTPCKDQGTSFVTHWVALASDWPTVFNDTFLLYDLSRGDIPKSSSIILYRGEDYKSTIQKPLFWWNVYSIVHILSHTCICILLPTVRLLQNCWRTLGQRTPLTAFTRKVIETRNVGHWNVKANLDKNQSLVVNFIIKSNTRKCYYWERLIKNEWSKCRHKLTQIDG